MTFIPEWVSFQSSYCIDMIKLTGSASSEVLACVVLLCARSDTHALLDPNYKEQQLMISLKFSISLGVRWANPSPCSRVFTSAASVDCSALSYLFSSAIAPISCSQKLLQNVAKNLKTVKTEKKQNKTKQKEKKNTIFWNLKTIDPSNFEVNQIEGAKIIFKRAFQASSVPTVTVVGVVPPVARNIPEKLSP